MSNLYKEAERFLTPNQKEGSLQTRVFNAARNKQIKTDPKHVYALVSSTLKYKPFILDIIKKAKLLKEEKQIRETQALLLVHDLLFSRSGRIQMGKTPLKDSVLKHKTRLSAELTKLKLKHKVRSFDELIEEDDTPVRWFRANTIKTTKEKVLSELEHLEEVDSIKKIQPGTIYHDEFIPNLFGIHPKEKITTTKLYEKGHIIIQDRASCFPAHILNPGPDDYVIDSCAAPGNKTTHLASYIQRDGSINAFERDVRRSKILDKMVTTAGASKIVKINTGDFTQSKPSDFEDVTGLVVDPSCSGSGIFGRAHEEENPEGSYSDERLQKLSSFQFSIVKHALSFPNAKKVVYSTCSIHAQENERVVIDLLNDSQVKNAGWKVANRSRVIPMWPRRGLVEEFQSFPNPEQLAGGCIRSIPKVDGGIGFFAVLFERDVGSELEKAKDVKVEDIEVEDAEEEGEQDQEDQESEYEEWNGFD
ncbi:putative methyltransferase [Wickerhamomyces ciferrii]|uniref:Methyltransferase n=1 Tax=Wickerhamomyces ciferrii (strain ATCC 14091 / BCRC 22168 / CBS 111 / JCM 3599 / NBRC 0793 / NRRL Y-1031 F-60-10) TaxID=1206466 RepID=K0KQL1_WICCF|nr:putative methyltransferase [Wickerhamomyces ciferrii]CCH43644.1 putative methyltransferase [Wickerhamomyces ciferrii]